MLIPLLLTIIGGLAHAAPGIYKWVDPDGNVHFSDCPPEPAEKCEVEEVAVAPGADLSEEELQQIAESRAQYMRELDERAQAREQRQKQREEKRTARAQQAEFRRQQCLLAHNNLEELLRAAPVYRLESRSTVVRQGEDETLKDIETMRELIDEYCDD